jgi:DMSO/TMAO reductase YedYZ molybdopterin-dependent catalytic subunit
LLAERRAARHIDQVLGHDPASANEPSLDRGPFRRIQRRIQRPVQRPVHWPIQWHSPIRGPWLTSILGSVLLIGIPVEFVTGLLSYAALNPRLHQDPNPAHGVFGFYLFNWFTKPSWLYQVDEGVHVFLGYALVPVVVVKLWSVIPKLFSWPIAPTLARLLERFSLILLVGGVALQFVTGILYVDYKAAPGISFYTSHFFGAWIFMAGFTIHVAVKFPTMVRSLRSRRLRTELRTSLADTRPEPIVDDLVATDPAPATMSRRGLLALVGGSSLLLTVLTAGGSIGGWTRRFAFFSTRDRNPGTGPNGFPVNHTAASVGITDAHTGTSWRLELVGGTDVLLSREQLLAMKQTTAVLPIACTEGWATTQTWTGVPLADLAALAGRTRVRSAGLLSLEGDDLTTLSGAQVHASKSLLALKVNGADLSLDHGFPARVIVPSAPGNYNRKWISRIVFAEEG